MSCGAIYTPLFRQRGYRMTPQRQVILHVLKSQAGHQTAQAVYEQARALLPALTESTVYRTLDFLVRQGVVHPVLGVNGEVSYELSESPHHHLVCRRCGKDVTISDQSLQQLYAHLESETGYRLLAAHLTFVGLCSDCRQSEAYLFS